MNWTLVAIIHPPRDSALALAEWTCELTRPSFTFHSLETEELFRSLVIL